MTRSPKHSGVPQRVAIELLTTRKKNRFKALSRYKQDGWRIIAGAIMVVPQKNGRYSIVDGALRYYAAKRFKMPTMMCLVFPSRALALEYLSVWT